MKKITLGFTLLFCCLMMASWAQKNQDILLTVGNENITKSEFLQTYCKNNDLAKATESDLRDYLNLFINFKMKVFEGVEMKLDTSKKFKMELQSYEQQSSQQYLIDKEVSAELLNEAMERAKTHIRAAHILIRVDDKADPKDTLAAYQQIMKIRKQIVSGKISFAEAAEKFSEDPSARDMVNPQNGRIHYGNKGDLGYFSVFDLIYPFENGAYNTPVGSVSMPVRTQFGYHLIYVEDRVPAIQTISIAQIYISDTLARFNQQSPETKKRIQEISTAFKKGTSFEDVVTNFSDEVGAGEKGGIQEPFAPNRRTGSFVQAILQLKNNEISTPIPSQNGWHIVKLINIEYQDFDDNRKFEIQNRIARDMRTHKSSDSFINKLKKEYNYKEAGREKAVDFIIKNMPPEFFQSKESKLDSIIGIDKLDPVATFADTSLSAIDFAHFMNRYKGMRITPAEYKQAFESRFDVFVNDRLTRYEKNHLMTKYPELRALVQEFHDGMVLYEVNTIKVWAEAINDTIGLKKFFEENQQKYIDPKTQKPNNLEDIRAIVITDFQDYLDATWIEELRKKYHPTINEQVFSEILKK